MPTPKEIKQALWAKPVPQKEYRKNLDYIMPLINIAIKKAENNPNNFGVLSQQVNSPKEANKTLNQSIANNFWRWLTLSKDNQVPDISFVDFMQKRWAPIGASNDPKNLNKNWAPNVKSFLQQQLSPEEYKKWDKMNLVYNNPDVLFGGLPLQTV